MNVCVYVCVFLRMYKKARERERERPTIRLYRKQLVYICAHAKCVSELQTKL